MSIMLETDQIERIESFISSNEPQSLPCLSFKDYETAKTGYNEIKTEPIGSYQIFGSNAYGYTCYAFYKAKNLQIYVITVFIQSFRAFSLVDETWDVLK